MPTMPADNKRVSADTPAQQQQKKLEQIYGGFSARFNALKKEKNRLIAEIMKKIDEEKAKRILNKIK